MTTGVPAGLSASTIGARIFAGRDSHPNGVASVLDVASATLCNGPKADDPCAHRGAQSCHHLYEAVNGNVEATLMVLRHPNMSRKRLAKSSVA